MSRTIVVVPCYNEAQRLPLRAFQEFARSASTATLLFVDDGSRDATLSLLEQLHRDFPERFSYLHLGRNSGKAEAVRQGMLLACRRGADVVGFWDADLATPLEDIAGFERVLRTKPHIDMVIGTRMRLLGHAIERQPLRYWLGRVFANVASLTLGVRVFDTQCGAKLFRVGRHLERVIASPFLARWIFDVEMFARWKSLRRESGQLKLAQAIYEFPLDAWQDVAGSKVKSGDFLKAIVELSKIYWTYLRHGAAGVASDPVADEPSKVIPPSTPHDRQKAA